MNIGITLAIFRLLGYTPADMARLKIFTNAGARKGGDSLINFVEYSSGPAELLFLRFFMAFFITISVILCKSIKCEIGSPRYFLKSELFWFENLLARDFHILLNKILGQQIVGGLSW